MTPYKFYDSFVSYSLLSKIDLSSLSKFVSELPTQFFCWRTAYGLYVRDMVYGLWYMVFLLHILGSPYLDLSTRLLLNDYLWEVYSTLVSDVTKTKTKIRLFFLSYQPTTEPIWSIHRCTLRLPSVLVLPQSTIINFPTTPGRDPVPVTTMFLAYLISM